MLVQAPIPSSALLQYVGKVRCPLYDTIPYTAAERTLIDSREFQRLRRLRQTAFAYFVFPGATHSRFEHSLGVMHTVGIFFDALVRNQDKLLRDLEEEIKRRQLRLSGAQALADDPVCLPEIQTTTAALKELKERPEILQLARFAGLLHDVGHAPFSHSGERLLPTWGTVARSLDSLNLAPWLRETLEAKIEKIQARGSSLNTRVKHEFYSLLIISRLFRGGTEAILSPDFGQDVAALLDADVPLRPDSPLRAPGLRNLVSQITSGEIDADRMDYLRRDAMHCGVVYGFFDASRILDAVVFYRDLRNNELNLGIHMSGLAAYEDFLRARMSMYQQVYFHKTGTACEAMLAHISRLLEGLELPLNPEAFHRFDDQSFYFLIEREMLRESPNRSPEDAARIEEGLEELRRLLFDRKLWKRVYEETHTRVRYGSTPSLTPGVLKSLRRNGHAAEIIASETSLSSFSPKGRVSSRDRFGNSLRVVVRDVRGLSSLQPIEDHSRLINNLEEERLIQRVFVRPKVDQSVTAVRDAIGDYLGSPSPYSAEDSQAILDGLHPPVST